MNTKQIVRIQHNKVMQYDWGSTDQSCSITRFSKQQYNRYAELWMGTHRNGPSNINSSLSLLQFLQKSGKPCLPFLFKVLCIEKALSIQIHPNKEQAERLFKQKPNIYADDNEKPQMFFTLTPFQCFFGIISYEDYQKLIKIRPFSDLKHKESLKIKDIIAEILQIDSKVLHQMIDQFLQNIEKKLPERSIILKELQKQFPYDHGLLISCLLQYHILPAGKCFAIGAGVPHAYLKGECLEIMKNSDNVVRLGLTPKLKDIQTMLEIMKDDIGLSGIAVEEIDQGYLWNHLQLKKIETLKEQHDIQISLKADCIGLLFEGGFKQTELDVELKQGEVYFLNSGVYRFYGKGRLYIGGYVE